MTDKMLGSEKLPLIMVELDRDLRKELEITDQVQGITTAQLICQFLERFIKG